MNDAMRNAMDGFAHNFAAHDASNANCLANTADRCLGVREIVSNNSTAIKELLERADQIVEILRGPGNCECCDGARVANPEGLLSEVTRQSQALDDLCRKLLTAISLLNG